MTAYILSRITAQKICDTWFSLGLSASNITGIYNACNAFTVFEPSATGTTRALKELQNSDEVRLYLKPGENPDQQDLIPYGPILQTIIDVGSGPVASPPDNLPKFTIVYE